MTKTLTEQWKDGELSNGRYYVKDWDGTINRFVAQNKILWRDSNNPIYASERIEVLAPVPSYDEYRELLDLNVYEKDRKKVMRLEDKVKHLQKKLEIATKALKEYADEKNWRTATTVINTDYFEYECSMYNLKNNGFEEAQKALKEMEGVK